MSVLHFARSRANVASTKTLLALIILDKIPRIVDTSGMTQRLGGPPLAEEDHTHYGLHAAEHVQESK